MALPAAAEVAEDKLGEGLGAGAGLGVGAPAGSPAFDPVAVLAAGLLFAAASFAPANAGITNTAATRQLQSHCFQFISGVFLLDREPFIEVGKRNGGLPGG